MRKNALHNAVEALGGKLAAIPVERLADVKQDFGRRGIDTAPYFRFELPDDLGFTPRSVLVAASPSPPAAVKFTVDGAKRSVVIPATYIDFEESKAQVHAALAKAAQESGCHIALAKGLPLKPLAVRSGLAALGRNNTVYVDGMGSFLNLSAFYSDLPCDSGCFFPLKPMDACADCGICVESCPTCALSHEKDLIDAGRCLTMLNELPGAFPGWVQADWHNALVGCTACQHTCPHNRAFLAARTVAVFDEEETRAFLRGELSAEQMEPLGSLRYFKEVLPRNLKALL